MQILWKRKIRSWSDSTDLPVQARQIHVHHWKQLKCKCNGLIWNHYLIQRVRFWIVSYRHIYFWTVYMIHKFKNIYFTKVRLTARKYVLNLLPYWKLIPGKTISFTLTSLHQYTQSPVEKRPEVYFWCNSMDTIAFWNNSSG